MLYAILCYNSEDVVCAWSKEQDDAVMAKLAVVQEKLDQAGPARAGGAAAADHRGDDAAQGPRAAAGDRRAVRRDQGTAARLLRGRMRRISRRRSRSRASSARPIRAAPMRSGPVGALRRPASASAVTDIAWIDAALTSARPQAIGALLRYFRDLDTAEEAFQEACLRALKTWPQNGPPRDPAAWLIFVGRNVAHRRGAPASASRRRCRTRSAISDLDDAESDARRTARQRALPRRHPAAAVHLLPSRPAGDAADRARAAHRVGSDRQADRARLPGERERHGAAHHARQGAHRRRRRAVRDAGRGRARRAARRCRGDDLPDLQRGLFGEQRRGRGARAAVRGGDPARPPAAAPVPGRARDHGTCRAAAAAARARAGALRRATARSCCSRTRTARCGTAR